MKKNPKTTLIAEYCSFFVHYEKIISYILIEVYTRD